MASETSVGGGEVITVEFLTKSFEAMWYQGEVLHKRTQDRIDGLEKLMKTHTEQEQKMEDMIKDRIMMFSQDIIATMKEMRAVEQDRINLLFDILNPKCNGEDITHDHVHDHVHEVLAVPVDHFLDDQEVEHGMLPSVEEEPDVSVL